MKKMTLTVSQECRLQDAMEGIIPQEMFEKFHPQWNRQELKEASGWLRGNYNRMIPEKKAYLLLALAECELIMGDNDESTAKDVLEALANLE